MPVWDTYETAGRRVMLLGRLIDEQEARTAAKFAERLAELRTEANSAARRRQLREAIALPAA